ncbi:hypothetical protein BDQ94DRAFT_157653 [Aspergillus welwitschiae]|uniref:Uncharacterized protein n=1 Tax=Aspergillus welwitschiae TaxID=1341132 RepID=A0A3F3QD94_9EURO|nr:hypothetical protein BDQ94DRAFT_157653 [Aspergillus welwitschiae]RDH36812.1 hypothetical protein BDQ94DRAFT_157653 [Aspergillus welwitschiae]
MFVGSGGAAKISAVCPRCWLVYLPISLPISLFLPSPSRSPTIFRAPSVGSLSANTPAHWGRPRSQCRVRSVLNGCIGRETHVRSSKTLQESRADGRSLAMTRLSEECSWRLKMGLYWWKKMDGPTTPLSAREASVCAHSVPTLSQPKTGLCGNGIEVRSRVAGAFVCRWHMSSRASTATDLQALRRQPELHCSTRLLLGGCCARASSTGFPAALYSDADQFTRSSAVDAHTAGAVVFRIPRPLWHIPVPPADWLGPGDSLVG